MGLKGTRRSSAGVAHQHRRLHFQESFSVQVSPDSADNMRTLDKGIPCLRVHDQIHVSLAIARVRVGQAVIFLRKDLQALGEKSDLRRMDGDLSRLGLEHFALQADDVADIQLFKLFVGFLSQTVSCHIGLDIAGLVQDVAERGLAHHTLLHHTPCQGDLFAFHLLIVLLYVRRMAGHVIAGDGKWILPVLLQLRQLLPAYLPQLIQIWFLCVLVLLAHVLLSFLLSKEPLILLRGPYLF